MIGYTPTRVGYEAAAFVRYRVPYGADQSRKIEAEPTGQWGLQGEDAAGYRSFNSITFRQYHSWRAELAATRAREDT